MDIHRGKGLSFLAGLGVGATLALSDSARGARKRAQARLEKTPRTNHELAAWVCAELDHDVEHGKGIQVFADDNRVTLRGVALRDELHDVLSAVRRVNGVRALINCLEVRDSPGKVLALQGNG